AEIRGHRRTYVGAMPGRIIQSMKKTKSKNPVFLMDEIDKMSVDFRGDPSSALLEVLDPEQNYSFSDHYLEVGFDLSGCFFITTANIIENIPHSLRDRMEVVKIPGYTEAEKMVIAYDFLLPKELKADGIRPEQVSIQKDALTKIIRGYTKEAGLRGLQRRLAQVLRKSARKIAKDETVKIAVSCQNLQDYLGPEPYSDTKKEEQDEVGVATGLAWTEFGGDIMAVESALMRGKGKLILTGKLGEVMRESAQAALTYIRSEEKNLGLKRNGIFSTTDIHIHVPEGAIPKDGPSAGITMATALVSSFTKKPVRRDVAMTGEITLRGRVLEVGGLKSKILAAHRAGIKTVIIPNANKKDLTEIPDDIKKALDFVPVKNMNEVLKVALRKAAVGIRKEKGR
ncbi:MAG: S16 family serine protease, partial [Candidatus Omnitrophota bacterium]